MNIVSSDFFIHIISIVKCNKPTYWFVMIIYPLHFYFYNWTFHIYFAFNWIPFFDWFWIIFTLSMNRYINGLIFLPSTLPVNSDNYICRKVNSFFVNAWKVTAPLFLQFTQQFLCKCWKWNRSFICTEVTGN